MKTLTIAVRGMSCEGCVRAVTNALQVVQGVKNVEVSLERQEATVTFDDTVAQTADLKLAVEEAGYETE
jgi:copper ion binding protein